MDPTQQPSPPNSAPPADPVALAERMSSAFAAFQSEVAGLERRSEELNERERLLGWQSAELGERERALAEQEEMLRQAREQLARDAEEWNHRQESLSARESVVAAREAEVDAQARRNSEASALLVLRRARLKRQRALLTERAEMLLRAQQAISKRMDETRRLSDSLRAGTTRPVGTPRPRSSSASLLTSAGVAAIGVAAVVAVSWVIAGAFDQPEYLARTTLAMETPTDHAGADAAESWRSFQEQLARDPHLIRVAAERLKRRGHDDLGTPAGLNTLLNSNLAVDSPGVGQVRLTLRGRGRDRTLRVLETFASAMVSLANDSRDRRLDGAATLILSPASVDAEPVRSARPMIFAGTSAALVLAGVGCAAMWRRAVGLGQRRDEHDHAAADDSDSERVIPSN